MRDDEVRRYARHILIPDVGGLGQTALLGACARLDLRDGSAEAAVIAATFLVAGGVGTLAIRGLDESQRARLAAHNPDTTFDPAAEGIALAVADRPAWWPSTEGDALALAYWRGGLAATRWMAAIANP